MTKDLFLLLETTETKEAVVGGDPFEDGWRLARAATKKCASPPPRQPPSQNTPEATLDVVAGRGGQASHPSTIKEAPEANRTAATSREGGERDASRDHSGDGPSRYTVTWTTGHGSGLRSGFKVGIDATFGGSNSKEQKHEYDDHLGDRYQKSPSITVEIRAREPPEPPTTEPPPPKGFSLRRIVKRRRKGRRTTTPPPLTLPPPPAPDMSLMPTYRKELMYPEYAFGPYKGHTLMGFTYDGQDFKS
ncbi:hypothetical protein HPB50_013943 [Hyalomma asiaticum]|uniref:Uncharacterized protein n=1 Tax=Hyalomma asiaticum TaxID=266040 RepID=A0ACB7S1D0_HYAAI|nr:hypothetical protein HPB50_013943 [Hyalomma asiaticum]